MIKHILLQSITYLLYGAVSDWRSIDLQDSVSDLNHVIDVGRTLNAATHDNHSVLLT